MTRGRAHALERDPRLGVLLSHPIQYVSPWLRQLAGELALKVYYVHRQSAEAQGRAGFSRPIDWDVPLLDGYDLEWLDNAARRPGADRFLGCDVPGIGCAIRRDRLDALLVFGWRHKSTWQALRACRRLGIRILARGDSTLDSQRPWWKRATKAIFYPPLLRAFDAHLYVGEANRRYLEHYGVAPERLFFAPHAVDQHRFRRQACAAREQGERLALRGNLGIARDAHVYLFVGKLVAGKRVVDLLQAFEQLQRLRPEIDAHAVIVGDGPERAALEARSRACAARVHVVGFRNQSQLPAWYAMADTLVVPGAETWGLVVNEAGACGLPALVSDRVGCRHDLVDEPTTGRVFAMGSPSQLVRAMIDMREMMLEHGAEVTDGLARKCREYCYASATTGLRRALDQVRLARAPAARAQRAHAQLATAGTRKGGGRR